MSRSESPESLLADHNPNERWENDGELRRRIPQYVKRGTSMTSVVGEPWQVSPPSDWPRHAYVHVVGMGFSDAYIRELRAASGNDQSGRTDESVTGHCSVAR